MRRVPLYVRILVGVALGALLGVVFGERPIVFHVTNRHLGDLGLLVIRLLKALAVPLIFFAIGAGSLPGPTRPYHVVASKPG